MSDATPENQSNGGEIREDAYVYALEQLIKGTKPRDIRVSLIDAGYTPKQVEQIIQYATNYRKQHANDVPVGETKGGGQLIVGGLGVWMLNFFIRNFLQTVRIGGAIPSLIMLGIDILGLVLVIMGIIRVIRRNRAMKQ